MLLFSQKCIRSCILGYLKEKLLLFPKLNFLHITAVEVAYIYICGKTPCYFLNAIFYTPMQQKLPNLPFVEITQYPSLLLLQVRAGNEFVAFTFLGVVEKSHRDTRLFAYYDSETANETAILHVDCSYTYKQISYIQFIRPDHLSHVHDFHIYTRNAVLTNPVCFLFTLFHDVYEKS